MSQPDRSRWLANGETLHDEQCLSVPEPARGREQRAWREEVTLRPVFVPPRHISHQ